MSKAISYLGIDLGGTKLGSVLLDEQHQPIDEPCLVKTPSNYKALLTELAQCIHHYRQMTATPMQIGICHPGVTAVTTQTMKNSNLPWMNGKPFISDLENAINQQVSAANDGNCFTLAEAVDGAARSHRLVFGITLGTCVGGGLVFDDQVWQGQNRIAAEWGHTPLPWQTEAEYNNPTTCFCGSKNCLDTIISGTGLENDYLQTTGTQLKAKYIVEAADAGESIAQAVVDRFKDRLARALANLMNTLDPDAIVIGGGLAGGSYLFDDITQRWCEYVFTNEEIKTPLYLTQHGRLAGARGAAFLNLSQGVMHGSH